MKQIGILKNPVQKYAWGSKRVIQSLLDLPEPWQEPIAELWLGAHPKAPSRVRVNGRWRSLIEIINGDPLSVLGKPVAVRFKNEFPFLLKLLAVNRPLSLQVHPSKDQASAGFDRENRLQIPVDAPNRNYRDPNHKPEFLCAVTRFEAMKGFRRANNILNLMERILPTAFLPELLLLKTAPNAEGVRRFFESLCTMDSTRKGRVIREAVQGAKSFVDEDRAFHWVLVLNDAYGEDMGVLSPLFLNLVALSPGEGLYVPAGEIHAYLRGVAVEIMASSDNVLRGGLTRKHMDIEELLKIITCETTPVQKPRSFSRGPFEKCYGTPADEFRLSKIVLKGREVFESETKRSVEILLCMEGKGLIQEAETGRMLPLEKGGAVIIPSVVPRYVISGGITLYKGAVGAV